MTRKNTHEDFWKYVDKSPGQGPNGDCWIWIGGTFNHGYGRFGFNDKKWKTNRLSFFISNGYLTPDLYILHSCNEILCVNPAHLREGTQQDNMDDMVAAHRHRSVPSPGEKNGTAVLKEWQVRAIRGSTEYLHMSNKEIGDFFGVTSSTIRSVRDRKTWKHI